MKPRLKRQRRDATSALVERALSDLGWDIYGMASVLRVTTATVRRWRRGGGGMSSEHASALLARLAARRAQPSPPPAAAKIFLDASRPKLIGRGVLRFGKRVVRLWLERGQNEDSAVVRAEEGSRRWTFATKPGDNETTWTTTLVSQGEVSRQAGS